MARATDGRHAAEFHEIWDIYHPSMAQEEEPVADDIEEAVASVPTIDHLPDVVDYSDRAPGDWVVSGPMKPSGGNGRYFSGELEAYRWCCAKYGQRRVTRVFGGENRWAMLIKKV